MNWALLRWLSYTASFNLHQPYYFPFTNDRMEIWEVTWQTLHIKNGRVGFWTQVACHFYALLLLLILLGQDQRGQGREDISLSFYSRFNDLSILLFQPDTTLPGMEITVAAKDRVLISSCLTWFVNVSAAMNISGPFSMKSYVYPSHMPIT